MKRIFRRFKEKISFKESPPPYRESDDQGERHREFNDPVSAPACEVLDLLANCKIAPRADESQESEVEYAEIKDMGLWHSTPLAHRHKSKISLTWVLKENLESTKLPLDKLQNEDKTRKTNSNNVDRHQRHNQKFNENERYRKCKYRDVKDRVVGRNEYYHNLKFRSACEEFVNGQDTFSDDTSVATEEYTRKKHRHRHRRKKKSSKFGYDIRDLDSFLSEASIDRPGNIPVVVAYPTTLYQTQKDSQRELTLPLGTVVNAVFKNQQWLYVQTPHGDEGYVMYNACLPLGILPNRSSPQKKTPCWESSTDIYPRPCGNLTDTEKEQLRGRTRSESHYRPRRRVNNCAEKDFDTIYLKTKSVCSNIDRVHEKENLKVKRQTLLVVNSDYRGSDLNRTLSVQQGDVVILVQGTAVESDVDAEWFYVRKKDGTQGFIPAAIAGHGYI
ncbi:uncharacterized protein LOC114362429 isoform X1 [Ostrinia furnacalis]|uniref:uncharacterized protein LOC114362429 isoform X1 n=2 Tax=Ostrinia furnacalis TaxID=93504 RepID=UPI00103965FF|nr:uncharacterized protein LOC114362429 isoform X1 [Ostrinia furnacalis]